MSGSLRYTRNIIWSDGRLCSQTQPQSGQAAVIEGVRGFSFIIIWRGHSSYPLGFTTTLVACFGHVCLAWPVVILAWIALRFYSTVPYCERSNRSRGRQEGCAITRANSQVTTSLSFRPQIFVLYSMAILSDIYRIEKK
jgi:hypothetical protein